MFLKISQHGPASVKCTQQEAWPSNNVQRQKTSQNYGIACSLHCLFTQNWTTSPRFQLLELSVELTSLLKFQLCPSRLLWFKEPQNGCLLLNFLRHLRAKRKKIGFVKRVQTQRTSRFVKRKVRKSCGS
jgi:hypothetical protein